MYYMHACIYMCHCLWFSVFECLYAGLQLYPEGDRTVQGTFLEVSDIVGNFLEKISDIYLGDLKFDGNVELHIKIKKIIH